jgi:hypothetical protein
MISHRLRSSFPSLCRRLGFIVAAFLFGLPSAAPGQSFDAVGTRARGLAGAFVSVADDASATWWNPAGLPNSLILDGVIDFESSELIKNTGTPIPEGESGLRSGAGGVAFAFPSLGLSYYRVRESAVGPATAGASPGRQDPGTAQTARSLLTHQFGVSLAQSLGDAVTLGATVRLIHGSLGVAPVATGTGAEDALDAAANADASGGMRGDVDLGVLVQVSRVRFGLAARNLTEPSFDASDGSSWRLERAVRVGGSLSSDAGTPGRQTWVVAVDADLTRATTPLGDRRDLAVGAERWIAGRRVGLRGGVRASTAGEARTSASAGASVKVAGSVWVEAVATGGGDATARGWGLSAHMMF